MPLSSHAPGGCQRRGTLSVSQPERYGRQGACGPMPADTLDATRLQILRHPTTNGTSQELDHDPLTVCEGLLLRTAGHGSRFLSRKAAMRAPMTMPAGVSKNDAVPSARTNSSRASRKCLMRAGYEQDLSPHQLTAAASSVQGRPVRCRHKNSSSPIPRRPQRGRPTLLPDLPGPRGHR